MLIPLVFSAGSLFAGEIAHTAAAGPAREARALRLAVHARQALMDSYERTIGAPDGERALLLARESVRVHHTVEGDAVLREALWRLADPRPIVAEQGLDEGRPAPRLRSRRLRLTREFLGLGRSAAWLAFSADKRVALEGPSGPSREVSWPQFEVLRGPGAPMPMEAARPTSFLSRDRRLRFVEARVVDERGRVRAHTPGDWPIRFAHFDEGGRRVMTLTGRVSMDSAAPGRTHWFGSKFYVWDIPSGEKLSEVDFADYGGVTLFHVDATGTWVALKTEEAWGNRLFVMPIWPDLVAEEACSALQRDLHPTEWAAFMDDVPYRSTCWKDEAR